MLEKTNEKQTVPRYLVLDIVFYASSLNYDQGSGNYQELKKITQWDGSVKIMTSRYALRYSILEQAKQAYENEGWKLASANDGLTTDGVVQKTVDANPLDYPEFDLFGFLITERAPEQRVTPVKLTHAISLNSYNFDSQFTANLGLRKRAGRPGSDPVNIEEFKGFYVYNVTIDLERVGVWENPDGTEKENRSADVRAKRIEQLLNTLMYLKRDIKGRREDLSPWLVVAGVYKNMNYDTYMDRIELVKSKIHNIRRREKQTTEGEYIVSEIEHQESNDAAYRPKFKIHDLTNNQNIFQRTDIDIEPTLAGYSKEKTDFVNELLIKARLKDNNNANA